MNYILVFMAIVILLIIITYIILCTKNRKETLTIDNTDFGFIILTHVKCENTDKYWKNAIDCIRKFYNNKIIIINDNSDKKYPIDVSKYKNVEKINSEYPARGELLPYYYFYKNKFFNKAVILHDSMFINEYINFDAIDNAFFFTAVHTWNFREPIIAKLSLLNNSAKLIDVYENMQNKWTLCFGGQMVTTYDLLKTIVEKYNLFILLDKITTRDDRMDFERIIGLLYNIETDFQIKSILGDLHEYIPKLPNTLQEYINLKESNKLTNLPVIKLFTGR